MSLKRFLLALLVGTATPTMGALQILNENQSLLIDGEFWLSVGVVAVTSFSATLAGLLTTLAQALNLPVGRSNGE